MPWACLQVLLAQWLPGKALEQVLAAVTCFQQASHTSQALPTASIPADKQQSPSVFAPQLWLQCRLQV